MSCFICDNKTISAIVKGFVDYGVGFRDTYEEEPKTFILINQKRDYIGQCLLDQNYSSFNTRYKESNEPENYTFEDVEVDEGTIYGCMQCYIYQACETDDFFESNIYKSLKRLEEALLRSLIKKAGQKAPYGYGSFYIFE